MESISYVIDRQRHADRLRRELELLELQGPELPRFARGPRGEALARVGRGPRAHYVCID